MPTEETEERRGNGGDSAELESRLGIEDDTAEVKGDDSSTNPGNTTSGISSPNTALSLHLDSLIDRILSISTADVSNPQSGSGEGQMSHSSISAVSPVRKIPHSDQMERPNDEDDLPSHDRRSKFKKQMLLNNAGHLQTTPSISSINSNPSIRSNALNYKRQKQIINVSSAIKNLYSKVNRLRLTWDSDTRTVLIVTKIYDRDNIAKCHQITRWLLLLGIRTCVEDVVAESEDFKIEEIISMMKSNGIPLSPPEECPLIFWNQEFCKVNQTLPDVAITLGGDGTVLHTCWLFNEFCPPIMSFDLGSLGFLTMFPFELFISSVLNLLKFKKDKGYKMLRRDSVSRNLLEEQSLESNDIAKDTVDTKVDEINTSYSHKTEFSVIFRMRLAAVICRKHELSKIIPYIKLNKRHDPITECTQDAERKDYGFPFDVSLLENTPVNILNDIVIDRGPTPFVCEIEIYVDEIFLTLLRADGLVLATATGSTAYSLSAGGSLMHPSLSAMILTPICPHTVSFRPIVLPASASIRVCVPHRSRTDCWACFDGKNRVCINKGDSIIISASNHPLPTINRFGITADWFRKIENCLGWNRYYPKNYRPANFARPEDICDVNITQCDREEPENCRPPPE